MDFYQQPIYHPLLKNRNFHPMFVLEFGHLRFDLEFGFYYKYTYMRIARDTCVVSAMRRDSLVFLSMFSTVKKIDLETFKYKYKYFFFFRSLFLYGF